MRATAFRRVRHIVPPWDGANMIEPTINGSGKALRRMRQVRAIKQVHLAELMGVTQSTISRWERGTLPLSPDDLAAARDCLQMRPEPSLDAALKRLIESSSLKVHLVCDRTHRLLAASLSRQSEWRVNVGALKGQSLLAFASPEILAAEARLGALGWFEGAIISLAVTTGSNASDLVRITPGQFLWERITFSDGSCGRLVTTF
jgi:transcriptional regulator with XRE-family HTH domain